MSAPQVLVTGGAGYVGSHACKALANAGYQPVTVDNFVGGSPEAVHWGPCYRSDVGDREAVERVIRIHSIDAVLHFAAFAYVGESMRDPGRYFANNVSQSLALLEAMRSTGVRRIVFSSSCATYGCPVDVPISEATPQRPVNPYGESKAMVERMLRWYGECHDFQWVALRYFNAAGADPDGEIGEAHNPETHLVPLAIAAALRGGPALQVFGSDYATVDGTAVRDYVHVSDLADAHVLALRYLEHGGRSDAFNLGTGRGHTVRQVLAAVERVGGRSVPTRVVERRAGDPPVLVAAPERAGAELSWKPTRSELSTIVRTAWDWHEAKVQSSVI